MEIAEGSREGHRKQPGRSAAPATPQGSAPSHTTAIFVYRSSFCLTLLDLLGASTVLIRTSSRITLGRDAGGFGLSVEGVFFVMGSSISRKVYTSIISIAKPDRSRNCGKNS